jgi:hypothetical protein
VRRGPTCVWGPRRPSRQQTPMTQHSRTISTHSTSHMGQTSLKHVIYVLTLLSYPPCLCVWTVLASLRPCQRAVVCWCLWMGRRTTATPCHTPPPHRTSPPSPLGVASLRCPCPPEASLPLPPSTARGNQSRPTRASTTTPRQTPQVHAQSKTSHLGDRRQPRGVAGAEPLCLVLSCLVLLCV